MIIRYSQYLIIYFILALSTIFATSCGNDSGKFIIDSKAIENYTQYNWLDDSTKFPLTGNSSISSRPYSLEKGKYSIQFKAYGTKGENRLPRLMVDFGSYQLKVVDIDVQPTMYFVNFELPESVQDKFVFTFNDDYNSPTEDRNVFLYFPLLVRQF
jgi:hypothetical protein